MKRPEGYLLHEDETLLAKLAEGVSLVVDLGTCAGLSAYIVAPHARRVITVDLFEDYKRIVHEGARDHYEKVFNKNPHYYEDVKRAFLDFPNVTVVQGFTHEYAQTQNANSIDLLFVDADHTYSGVDRDFTAWLPKVKVGGTIAFHDATHDGWDVKRYLDSHVSMLNNVRECESSGVIRTFQKLF
jgi:predicted O-methyltransferase YrrM